jgi:hypothetical protein
MERRLDLSGIEFDIPDQVRHIADLAMRFGGELAEVHDQGAERGFDFNNPWFAGLDAALYYFNVRNLRPKTIIEIGCGYSTRIAARAVDRNRSEGHPCRHVCIEPFPEPRLLDAKLAIELVQQRVEDLPLTFFDGLGEGDILFIDSSHAVCFGSDVVYEQLSLLPALPPGVRIHIHDIFWPTDYPAEWLIDKRIAFNEQYLLQAFLMFNSAFKPEFCARWLMLDHAEELARLMPSGILAGPALGGSFWMQRVG